LSHYLPYRQAVAQDSATIEQILHAAAPLTGEQACGAHPLSGLLEVVRRRGLTAHLLDYRNSGDTAGDRGRVVGYAAIAFTQNDAR
jgi:AmmeMemoRadiSam system protein B